MTAVDIRGGRAGVLAVAVCQLQEELARAGVVIGLEVRAGRVAVVRFEVPVRDQYMLGARAVKRLASWADVHKCAVTFDLAIVPGLWVYLAGLAGALGWRGRWSIPVRAGANPMTNEILMRPYLGHTAREALTQSVADFHRLRRMMRVIVRYGRAGRVHA